MKCSVRTGKDDFVASLRKSLKKFYGEKVVALGGVFLVEKGSAYIHIMVIFFFLIKILIVFFFFFFYAPENRTVRPSVSPSVTNRVSAISHKLLEQI